MVQTDLQVTVQGNTDVSDILMSLVQQVADFWIVISILVTLTLVQMIKVVLKHYQDRYAPDSDPMVRKIFLFIIAMLIGYYTARGFLKGGDLEDWKLYAFAIAFLNPLIYQVILIVANRMGWIRVVGLLKMRKVIEDENGKLVLSDERRSG